MRTSIRLASITAALGLASTMALATPALADQTPVQATATIGQVMTVSGINGVVAFGNANPGQTVSVAHAQQIRVISNAGGAIVTLQNANGGFKKGAGQPDLFGNSAISVQTTTKGLVHFIDDPATYTLEQVPPGDTQTDETWNLTVPTTVTDSGNVFANYLLNVNAA